MESIISKRDICDFTVLMPTHNSIGSETFFERAVKSIYANTLVPSRTLIVIDGPVSQVFENKIREMQRSFGYDCLWLPNNVGITKALNAGLATIDTSWTIRADSDDVNLPDRFQALVEKLNDGYDLVGSWAVEIDDQGRPLCMREVPEDHDEIYRLCKFRNPMNHMATSYNTSLVKALGGYPDIYKREDYGLWAMMIRHGARCTNIQKCLVLATAGDGLYERRSGIRYIRGEIQLQRHLVHNNVSTWYGAVGIGLIRSVLFLAPKSIHSFIYRYFLRSDVYKEGV